MDRLLDLPHTHTSLNNQNVVLEKRTWVCEINNELYKIILCNRNKVEKSVSHNNIAHTLNNVKMPTQSNLLKYVLRKIVDDKKVKVQNVIKNFDNNNKYYVYSLGKLIDDTGKWLLENIHLIEIAYSNIKESQKTVELIMGYLGDHSYVYPSVIGWNSGLCVRVFSNQVYVNDIILSHKDLIDFLNVNSAKITNDHCSNKLAKKLLLDEKKSIEKFRIESKKQIESVIIKTTVNDFVEKVDKFIESIRLSNFTRSDILQNYYNLDINYIINKVVDRQLTIDTLCKKYCSKWLSLIKKDVLFLDIKYKIYIDDITDKLPDNYFIYNDATHKGNNNIHPIYKNKLKKCLNI